MLHPHRAFAAGRNGATAIEWVAEPNLNATIFTGGGSKDPIDINQWAWKDGAGGLPDKDNLLHSFAARYSLPPSATCPSGGAPTCEVLYFGSDRFDNSGDAQQGFWFFQNSIGLGSNPRRWRHRLHRRAPAGRPVGDQRLQQRRRHVDHQRVQVGPDV